MYFGTQKLTALLLSLMCRKSETAKESERAREEEGGESKNRERERAVYRKRLRCEHRFHDVGNQLLPIVWYFLMPIVGRAEQEVQVVQVDERMSGCLAQRLLFSFNSQAPAIG